MIYHILICHTDGGNLVFELLYLGGNVVLDLLSDDDNLVELVNTCGGTAEFGS